MFVFILKGINMEIIDAKHAVSDMQENIERFRGTLDMEALTEEIADYENRMTEPDFWNDNEKAQKVIEENNVLKNRRDSFLNLTNQVEELELLIEMAVEDPEDEDTLGELEAGVAKAQKDIDAYNKLKHNRDKNFHLATLENCINAIAANIILFAVRYSPRYLYDKDDVCSNLIKSSLDYRVENSMDFYIPIFKEKKDPSVAFSMPYPFHNGVVIENAYNSSEVLPFVEKEL